MNNDLIIRNWNVKNYHCALCGNNKSVKYWVTTKEADTILFVTSAISKPSQR